MFFSVSQRLAFSIIQKCWKVSSVHEFLDIPKEIIKIIDGFLRKGIVDGLLLNTTNLEACNKFVTTMNFIISSGFSTIL